jgi:signal transduction histidine kinase
VKLKYQLLLLALLSLLFPITGWITLRSIDKEFRQGIERASKSTLSTLKSSVQQLLINNPAIKLDGFVLVEINDFSLDGDTTEWSDVKAYNYSNNESSLSVKTGSYHGKLVMLIISNDASININSQDYSTNDHLIIALANKRGLFKYKLHRQAEGLMINKTAASNQPDYQAYWHEKAAGYAVEIQFNTEHFQHLGIVAVEQGGTVEHTDNVIVGTVKGNANQSMQLLSIVAIDNAFNQSIKAITPENNHFLITDLQGRIIYQSNKLPGSHQVSAWQWMITPVYRWLFSSTNEIETHWYYRQQDGMAGVQFVVTADKLQYHLKTMMPHGQQNMIQTLLKAGILMIAVVLLLMLAYLLYALVLAWRIKNLNRALQQVLDNSGQMHIQMPSHKAGDEIGQLSRGVESMLAEMREYTQYLKDLGARLSHEMKTPLAIVQTSLDNMELEQGESQFLSRAQSGTNRLKFILNQLSEVSQLKYTLENTVKEKINLTELCLQLGKSYQSIMPNIKLDIISKDIYVFASADLLAQMLDKLMDNARDFTPKHGEIELKLKISTNQAQISLINSGSQLPETGNRNIFDSLVTLRKNNAQQSAHVNDHLGLGLYLVQLIAKFHHSQVLASNHNNPNKVEFSLKLPIF